MIANVALMLVSAVLAATPCASLRSLSLSNTTITTAELVPAGEFRPPVQTGAGGRGGNAPQPAPLNVPAFCRVAATLRPSSDSEIDIEVWMPADNWNGKFEAVGNGGWAGIISYPAMASALQEGYATASTDTGHKGGNASFAIGHPEKVVDFAYRAVHETAIKAKAIMTAFYDRGGWNDTAISPGNTVDYYNSVLGKMGSKQDAWIRLFMAPGMQHCGNGPGPNQVNFMAVLERWRESGTAPDQLTAYHVTNNRVDMARPLCSYPQLAQYRGTGSTNDAANFVCKAVQSGN